MSDLRPSQAAGRNPIDKISLLAALIVLVASSAWLVFKLGSDRKAMEDSIPRSVEGKMAEPVTLSNELERIHGPALTVSMTGRMMVVSEAYVACVKCGKAISYNAATCPFCQGVQPDVVDVTKIDRDGDGIPDLAEKAMGLNELDPTDALTDPDGDRFVNLLEYRANSIHTNTASMPSILSVIRLYRVERENFSMLFKSVTKSPSGSMVFQMNTRARGQTHMKRIGESVDGWTIESYEEKADAGPTLTVKRESVVKRLVQGKVEPEESRTAIAFSLLEPSRRISMKAGQPIKLGEVTYNVVDITDRAVLLRDASGGTEITIGPASEEDRRLMAAPGSPAVVPGG